MFNLATETARATGAERGANGGLPVPRPAGRKTGRQAGVYVFVTALEGIYRPPLTADNQISYRWFIDCVTIDQLRRTPPFDSYSYRPGRRPDVKRLHADDSAVFYRSIHEGRPCVCARIAETVYVFCQLP